MTGISLQVVYGDKGIPDLALSDGHRLSRSDCEGLFKSVKFTAMSIRTLAPCPASPNCVSTQAQDEGHAILPIRYRKSRVEAKEGLKEFIRALPRTRLVEEDESYLHYEFTSLLLRFVDDVEFVFDDEAKTIHFRSASRTGYGDLGVNRARMEQVRALAGGKL